MEKSRPQSPALGNKRLTKLRELYPECFVETQDQAGQIRIKVDFERLRLALGDQLVEEPQERFRLEWPGKRVALARAHLPATLVPRPVPEESRDFFATKNIFFEGDNLEALKILAGSYADRVQMIYIDSPDNTGRDFIYNDDFSTNSDDYPRESGAVDQSSQRLKAKVESSGRLHSKWLSLMAPRLSLARNLLSDDGVIFISVGEEECHNLKTLCQEIFGQANFRNTIFTRRHDKNLSRQFVSSGLFSLAVGQEYILVYSKNPQTRFNPVYRKASKSRGAKGYWKEFWISANRPTRRYPLLGVTPQSGQWKWKREVAEEAVKNYLDYLRFFQKKMSLEAYWARTGRQARFIRRDVDNRAMSQGVEHWEPPSEGIPRDTNWSDMLASRPLGLDFPFDSPKNPEVITELIKFSNVGRTGLVLDFFAGSGATAQAVMELNLADGGERRFILAQLAAPIKPGPQGFTDLAQVARARIRLVAEKIEAEFAGNQEPGLFVEPLSRQNPLDLGFRAFRLERPDFSARGWGPAGQTDDNQVSPAAEPRLPRSELERLFEVMTRLGLDLGSPVAEMVSALAVLSSREGPSPEAGLAEPGSDSQPEPAEARVLVVGSNELVAFFGQPITLDLVTWLAQLEPAKMAFLESGFKDDHVKMSVHSIFQRHSPYTEIIII
ncbi:MAG: site-specific DNA-methyltransferase [Deltaproteobacteria bacterium]|jgi:adenine-specific DNA-methyltransferase|nr:site-specific DNA-methyltransferase [Deltaproteobacteria bacterium]